MGLVNNRGFMGSAESACLENATPNQITGLLQVMRCPRCSYMVSEVVATRSRGCEKTVNLVGRGKLNSSLSRQCSISITRQLITADFSRTQNYIIIGQTHFSCSDG